MKKRMLMIIDDDRDDIYFFMKAVKKLNESFECVSFESGTKALEQLSQMEQLPDFIFLDLNMPCLNGRSCIKEFKANTKLKHIPVIIYSTSCSNNDREALMQLGAAYYLSKPMDVSDLPFLITAAIQSIKHNLTANL